MKDISPAGISASAQGLSERELLERILSRVAAAPRLFYERYVGYLTAVCYRYVPDSHAAKDVLQESFIKMLPALEGFQYRGEGSLRAWASRIVVNTALNSLRGKVSFVSVESLPELPEEPEPEVAQVPAHVLQGLIQALPDGYRTVFNLFVFEKRTHREIASLLGIKEDSSASQYSRARTLLARQIKAYLKEHE